MYNFDNVTNLGENTGSVKDLSLYANNGTITSTTWTGNGKWSGSYNFDGLASSISIANTPQFNLTKDKTICMWINPSTFAKDRNPYSKAYGGE